MNVVSPRRKAKRALRVGRSHPAERGGDVEDRGRGDVAPRHRDDLLHLAGADARQRVLDHALPVGEADAIEAGAADRGGRRRRVARGGLDPRQRGLDLGGGRCARRGAPRA